MKEIKEIWKPLPPFTKTHNGVKIKYDFSKLYEVSNTGKIRRKGKLRELKLRLDNHGYLTLNLSKDGKMLKCLIHRLVAITFLENTENKRTVNHIDGVKTNNRVDNLEWATLSEQQKHAVDSGLKAKGEQHGRAKLTEAKVREIRDRYDNGCTQIKLAKEYGVSQRHISKIIRGENWNHV